MDETPKYSALIGSALAWFQAIDTGEASLVTIFIAICVIVFSGPLSSMVTSALSLLLQLFKIKPWDLLKATIRDGFRTALIALAALVIIRTLNFPELVDGILKRMLASAVLLYLAVLGYRLIDKLISGTMSRSLADSEAWVITLVRVVIVILACTAILEVWDVNISSALTGVGVLGAGFAIALQDFLKNVVAGISNRGERRFRRGDWIATNEVEGVIERIDLRSTMVMGFDRVPQFVPNNALSDAVLLNKSRIDHRRISWTVPLLMTSTDDQIDAVCADLKRHIEESGDFVTDGSRPVIVTVTGLSESSVDVMVYAFTKTSDWEAWLEICGRLVIALRGALTAANTALAYPTQTVHLQMEKRTKE